MPTRGSTSPSGRGTSGQYPDRIAELFAAFGPVTVRRMFSGAGVFADGLMIALAVRGTIFLKADDRTIPAFECESLGPFSYRTKSGPRELRSYWQMPERLYDDPDELAVWAREAMAAAQRGAARKRSPAGQRRKRQQPNRQAKRPLRG